MTLLKEAYECQIKEAKVQLPAQLSELVLNPNNGELKRSVDRTQRLINQYQEQLNTFQESGNLNNIGAARTADINRALSIKIITVFLASSSELKYEREQIEISINRENNKLVNSQLFIKLIVWEDFLDAMSQTRLQDEYNKQIRECDIFLSLYSTKVGMYTKEEFNTAYSNFRATNRPFIYTYFKKTDNANGVVVESDSITAFKSKLKELGHYPTLFTTVDDLKFQFKNQLGKLIPELQKQAAEQIPVTDEEFEEAEKQIDELKKQIVQLEKRGVVMGEPIRQSGCKVFIITGTNSRLLNILEPRISNLLMPPNHDDVLPSKWVPFTRDGSEIRDMINELKQKESRFTETYLDEVEDLMQIINEIEEDPEACIAIVDLLMLDQRNLAIAQRFNQRRIGGVITPICPYLNNEVKIYMEDKGKQVFSYLEYYLRKTLSDLYHPEAGGKSGFLQTLRYFISKGKPVIATISDTQVNIPKARMSATF